MNNPDLATNAAHERKLRDGAILLPVFGAFLLVSPLITVFSGITTVFGLPLIFVYVFGVWLGLVLIARAMARRLDKG
ncbi:MAG: hypothetical protein COB08_012610 [Rhodobacteraceae bacterium]|nr:hypothetical protein [Paracoccaceae bacterium]